MTRSLQLGGHSSSSTEGRANKKQVNLSPPLSNPYRSGNGCWIICRQFPTRYLNVSPLTAPSSLTITCTALRSGQPDEAYLRRCPLLGGARAPQRPMARKSHPGQPADRGRYTGHDRRGLDRVPQSFQQQFPACGFRPENTLVLISHFANSLCIMPSRIPYLTTWLNGVARHGTCSR